MARVWCTMAICPNFAILSFLHSFEGNNDLYLGAHQQYVQLSYKTRTLTKNNFIICPPKLKCLEHTCDMSGHISTVLQNMDIYQLCSKIIC